MDTSHFAGADDIFQNTVRLKEDMFAIGDLDLFSADGIDEGQLRQAAVIELRKRLDDLAESGFLDKHRMEDSVGRIGFGVLLDAAAGERSVTDVHGEEQIVHRLLAIDRQNHVLRLMLDDCGDEAEEIMDVVGTQVVFQGLGFLATERINAKTDRVDEIAVVGNAVTPIGDATYIYRMSLALEESPERLLVVLGQGPIPRPVVAGSARHESQLDSSPLLRAYLRTHDTVHRLAERPVAAENEDLIVAFLHQLPRQLNSMTRIFRQAIGKRLMALAQQFP